MKLLCPVVETNVSTRRTNSVCAELKYQCDGKNAVTLVSPLAVTGISIHTQHINPTFVTDDSKLLKIFGSSSLSGQPNMLHAFIYGLCPLI